MNVDEPESGIVCNAFAENNEDHWYRVVVRILNNGAIGGANDIESLDPSLSSKL